MCIVNLYSLIHTNSARSVFMRKNFLKKNAPTAEPMELKIEYMQPYSMRLPKKSLKALKNPL